MSLETMRANMTREQCEQFNRDIGWYPINTAPKDEPIVVWCPSVKQVFIVQWGRAVSGWLVFGTTRRLVLIPTRWRRRPASPMEFNA